ncbi:NAD(P)-dependent dehydrogenase (short-subunit alcohol dehydrogenase family) [Kribbella sp. VKM Ac-2527]|uniref:NAD(P)-dependent dehydrogenase (Short-subunit alcohol dehydrogenase family) n=1 Tax=Kribbella caucasensis TaxID=2512215 RepID=A0A4R6KJT3_9ACTN|nr:glucose 1-dehydrogenase [Kribbella sp. VKM Ac-2527]TDO51577.1 NAD(P)-dependent dehydrogenase (short-subunit alcohol dehydrogenase family) [Kribbella sp. VKM Ac-2527]
MNPTYDFSGQVALVTGGASGLGLATAQQFALSGAAVVIADVNAAAVAEREQAFKHAGHQVLGVACDVSDEAQVESMVHETVQMFGRLDMAFNNAGVIRPAIDTADERAEDFDLVNRVNARGVWACMKHELRQMREQGSGAIVNCSSLSGLVGGARRTTYHAAKHAVIGLSTSAAVEYASQGVRINAVCPGTVDTPMVDGMVTKGDLVVADAVAKAPIGRIGRPEEIAAAVLWLCSPGASFVIGVALPVDGGYVAQ